MTEHESPDIEETEETEVEEADMGEAAVDEDDIDENDIDEDELDADEEDSEEEDEDFDLEEFDETRDDDIEPAIRDDEIEFQHRDPTPAELAKLERLAQLRLEAKVEAIIFASQKPLKIPEILETLADETVSEDDLKFVLEGIVEHYEQRNGGFRLVYLKRLGYQFQTTQNAGPIMERMFASRPRPISRAALETLAIIAYRQPVTRAEVEFIRGVDAGSIFRTLMERSLIKCTGRKEVVGRPMMFGTTEEFLKVFNISSIKDLPPLEAFQPSPDTISGAKEKLGAEDSPVDIEKYIADNTGEESLNAEAEEEAADIGDESVEESVDETAEVAGEEAPAIEGAVAAEDDGEWDDEVPAMAEPERIEGATVADHEEPAEQSESAPEIEAPQSQEDEEEESFLPPEQDASSDLEK